MSAYFDLVCDDCQVVGPAIRRGWTAKFATKDNRGAYTGENTPEGAAAWALFLDEHEFHAMRLVTYHHHGPHWPKETP